MTDAQVQIVLAVLAFLFGVVTKFIIDLWDERRKRQSLTFTKRTTNSFSINMLGDSMIDKTELLFGGQRVKNIQVVIVEIENTGARAVKNQAFTVRFDEKARILATINRSNSEDARYVNEDARYVNEEGITTNLRRFHIQLLQRGHKLAWEFAVADNFSGNFHVEHGISKSSDNLSEIDLDVSSVITSSKAQLDLIARIKRTMSILILAISCVAVKDIGKLLQINEVAIGLDIVFLIVLFFLLRELLNIVGPWLLTFRKVTDDDVSASTSVNTQGGAYIHTWSTENFSGQVGRDYSVVSSSSIREISNEMAQQFLNINKHIDNALTVLPDDDKWKLNQYIRELLAEVQRGDLSIPQNFGFQLQNISRKSPEIYQLVVIALLTDKDSMNQSVREIVSNAYDEILANKQESQFSDKIEIVGVENSLENI